MTETDYGFSAVTCMNDLSRKNNLERLEKIRKGLSILDPKSKDEEIMQLYKLGLSDESLKIKTKLPRNRQSGLKEKENEKIQQITLRFNCSRKIHGEE